MTVPGNLSSPLLATAADAAAAAAGPIKSVRFDQTTTAHLNRTPSTAGNKKTWTWSGWVKRCTNGNRDGLFEAEASGNYTLLRIRDDTDRISLDQFGGSNFYVYTDAVFRDNSAWYHIVCAVDTTQATDSNRVKIYVNGVQQTLTAGTNWPTQNIDTRYNDTSYAMRVGGVNGGTQFDGYMADVYFVDGSQLDPTSFGAYDANGVWQAAEYSGTFGTNGFHLFDFANESTVGHDSSGNENDFTANNISDGESPRWFFDGSAGTKITGTIGTALGSGDFTVEMFIEKTTTESQEALFSFGGSSGTFETDSGAKVRYQDGSTYGSAIAANDRTHIAWVRDNSKGYIYVDGTLVSPSAGISDTTNYTATAFAIGSRPDNGEPFTGYIDNLRVVVGTAVYTSNFTVPSTPLTAVTNTKLLTLTSPTLADTSGQSVSLTNSGVVDEAGPGKDVLFDVPTNDTTNTDSGAGGEVSGNYASMNPLQNGGLTLSNGNLDIARSASGFRLATGTVGISSGKYYWEYTVTGGADNHVVGVTNLQPNLNTYIGEFDPGWGYRSNGSKTHDGSFTTGLTTAGVGDVIQIAVDMTAGKIWFGVNNTYVGSGNPGTGANAAYTNLSGTVVPAVSMNGTMSANINFGARSFAYSAPSNFKALCTTNLPTPTIADGSAYFDTALYTGNGSTQTVSGLNMSPDLVWMKTRSQANDHVLVDSVRGVGVRLFSNDTIAENTQSTSLTSFNSDGFSLGSHSSVNQNNVTHVAWAWDAGSSTVSNTDGSVTSNVRANPTAGFSIVSYTGTGSNATVGHGLNAVPELIILKDRDAAKHWAVWHKDLSSNAHYLLLNQTDAQANTYPYWNGSHTSSVFTLGTTGGSNESGDDFIAYCFTSVAGFSAIGSYTANGSSDGPFVHTGFAVAWLLTKRSNATASWEIHDLRRPGYNPQDERLLADSNTNEVSGNNVDFLSNGFKIRNTFSGMNNTSGDTYVYLAFAENPFQANGGLAR
jgi:hypothetical protein